MIKLAAFLTLSTIFKSGESLTMSRNSKLKVQDFYRQALYEEGAMNIERNIYIKATNVGSSIKNTVVHDIDSSDPSFVCSKIIHFQRHGQGYHNLLGDMFNSMDNEIKINSPDLKENPFVRTEIQDSPLTKKGRDEAVAERIYAATLNPEVVIVSPLHRAVQTALLTFADHYSKGINFVAHEGCREQLGLLVCNKAHPISQTAAEFPQVDFSLCTAGENDSLWNEYPTIREHPVREANRAFEFLTYFIMERKEKELAVVCHSGWLFTACNAVVDCDGDSSLESWFETGEIRSIKLSFFRKKIARFNQQLTD